MTSPIFVEDRPISRPAGSPSPSERLEDRPEASFDRVEKLESEVFALRDTVSRFAELMLNELKRIKPPEARAQVPVTVSMAGMAPVPLAIPTPNAESLARSWVLVEFFRDLMSIFRMYVDPRYRLRRTTQLFVPLMFGLIFLNYWIVGNIPLLGWILREVCTILLSILLYKIWYRELVRYREVIAQYNAVDYSGHDTRFIHSAEDAPASRPEFDHS